MAKTSNTPATGGGVASTAPAPNPATTPGEPVTQEVFDTLEDLVVIGPPKGKDRVYEMEVAGKPKFTVAGSPKQAAEKICKPTRVDHPRITAAALAALARVGQPAKQNGKPDEPK